MSQHIGHGDLIDQARVGTATRSAPVLRMSGNPPARIGGLNVCDLTARRMDDRIVVALTVADDAQWARHVVETGSAETVDGDQVVTPEAARIAFSGCTMRLSTGDSELQPWKCGFGGTGTERTAEWTFIVAPDATTREYRLTMSSGTTDTEIALHL